VGPAARPRGWMCCCSRTGFSREEASANTINCSTGRPVGAGLLANPVQLRCGGACPDAFASKPAPTVKLRGHKDRVSREEAGVRWPSCGTDQPGARPVGAGLLANRVGHSPQQRLPRRVRQQAGSYSEIAWAQGPACWRGVGVCAGHLAGRCLTCGKDNERLVWQIKWCHQAISRYPVALLRSCQLST
jgi:hypothetical protein